MSETLEISLLRALFLHIDSKLCKLFKFWDIMLASVVTPTDHTQMHYTWPVGKDIIWHSEVMLL